MASYKLEWLYICDINELDLFILFSRLIIASALKNQFKMSYGQQFLCVVMSLMYRMYSYKEILTASKTLLKYIDHNLSYHKVFFERKSTKHFLHWSESALTYS